MKLSYLKKNKKILRLLLIMNIETLRRDQERERKTYKKKIFKSDHFIFIQNNNNKNNISYS